MFQIFGNITKSKRCFLLEGMLDIIEEHLPQNSQGWHVVTLEYNRALPHGYEKRSIDSIRRKFTELKTARTSTNMINSSERLRANQIQSVDHKNTGAVNTTTSTLRLDGSDDAAVQLDSSFAREVVTHCNTLTHTSVQLHPQEQHNHCDSDSDDDKDREEGEDVSSLGHSTAAAVDDEEQEEEEEEEEEDEVEVVSHALASSSTHTHAQVLRMMTAYIARREERDEDHRRMQMNQTNQMMTMMMMMATTTNSLAMCRYR